MLSSTVPGPRFGRDADPTSVFGGSFLGGRDLEREKSVVHHLRHSTPNFYGCNRLVTQAGIAGMGNFEWNSLLELEITLGRYLSRNQ